MTAEQEEVMEDIACAGDLIELETLACSDEGTLFIEASSIAQTIRAFLFTDGELEMIE